MFGKHKECSWYAFVFQISLPVCWIDFSHRDVTDPIPVAPTRLRKELPASAHVGRVGFPPESSFSLVNRAITSWLMTLRPPFCFSPCRLVTACLDCLPSAYVNFFKRSLRSQNSSVWLANSTWFGDFFQKVTEKSRDFNVTIYKPFLIHFRIEVQLFCSFITSLQLNLKKYYRYLKECQ